MTTPEATTVERMTTAMIQRRLTDITRRLRDMADEVERAQSRLNRVPAPGVPTYATVVSNVQHSVLWGLANLSIDGLTTLAAEADVAREKGE